MSVKRKMSFVSFWCEFVLLWDGGIEGKGGKGQKGYVLRIPSFVKNVLFQ